MFFNSTRFAILQICEAPTNQFCADPVGRRHKRNPLSSTSEGFSPQRFRLCLLSTLPSLWGRVLGPGGFYCCDLGLESPFLMWAGGNGTDQPRHHGSALLRCAGLWGKGILDWGIGFTSFLLDFLGGFLVGFLLLLLCQDSPRVPGQSPGPGQEFQDTQGCQAHPCHRHCPLAPGIFSAPSRAGDPLPAGLLGVRVLS